MAACVTCNVGTCFSKQDMTGDKNLVVIIVKGAGGGVGEREVAERVPLEFRNCNSAQRNFNFEAGDSSADGNKFSNQKIISGTGRYYKNTCMWSGTNYLTNMQNREKMFCSRCDVRYVDWSRVEKPTLILRTTLQLKFYNFVL